MKPRPIFLVVCRDQHLETSYVEPTAYESRGDAEKRCLRLKADAGEDAYNYDFYVREITLVPAKP